MAPHSRLWERHLFFQCLITVAPVLSAFIAAFVSAFLAPFFSALFTSIVSAFLAPVLPALLTSVISASAPAEWAWRPAAVKLIVAVTHRKTPFLFLVRSKGLPSIHYMRKAGKLCK